MSISYQESFKDSLKDSLKDCLKNPLKDSLNMFKGFSNRNMHSRSYKGYLLRNTKDEPEVLIARRGL